MQVPEKSAPVLGEERVPVTERPPVEEGRVKQRALAERFARDSKEARCLSIDEFRRSDSVHALR